MRGGDVVMELASRCGYTMAVEVALNKIAQNIEFTKSLPKSAIEKILPGEAWREL